MALKGQLLVIQQNQEKQRKQLKRFLFRDLNYQVQCELLINIEKLEEKLQIVSVGIIEVCVQDAYYFAEQIVLQCFGRKLNRI